MLLLEKFKEKKLNIFFIILISLCIAVFCTFLFSKKEYVSTSTLLLIKTEKRDNEEVQKVGNLELSNELISIMEDILKSSENISKINENNNISNNEIKNKINLKKNSKSDTFEIETRNINQEIAVEQGNKLIEILSKNVEELYSNTEVYIIDNPHIEKYSYDVQVVYPIIFSLIFGIIISTIYLIILIIIEKNKKIYLKIENEINLKKLIEIPLKQYKKDETVRNELIAYESEKSNISKAFKTLRSNIQFINVNNNEKNIILVTSPRNLEGKSYIASNLSVSFAEVGKKVILIDSDMISGRQNQIFNIPNNLGFSNYLSNLDSNGIEIKKLTNNFIHETSIKNLNLITSGTIPPNPTELLTSERFDQLIKDLSVFYDVIIIDGTSILNSMEALILTRKANSTIIVSDYKKTKREDLLKCKKDIQNVGGRPIGIIINKIKVRKTKEEIKSDISKIKIKLKENFEKIVIKFKEKTERSKQKLLEKAQINEEKNEIIISDSIITENDIVKKQKDFKVTIEEKVLKDSKQEEYQKSEVIENVREDYDTNTNQLSNTESKEKFNMKNLFSKANSELEISKNEEKTIIVENEEKIIKEDSELKIEQAIPNDFDSIIIEEKNDSELKDNAEPNDKVQKIIIEKYNKIKEFSLNSYNNIKNFVKEKKQKNKENIINNVEDEFKEEHLILDNNEKKHNKNEGKNISNKKKKNSSKKENEKNNKTISTLIIIDAERGYCRVFSDYYFTEKSIRGIDKTDGFNKDQYSKKLITSRRRLLMNTYNMSAQQVKRIDPLIYSTLSDYDDYVWLEKKMISNKAETYALIMAKEYEKLSEETPEEFIIRSKRLRKQELKKAEIDIEYILKNMWKNSETSIIDKLMMQYYYNVYEIKKDLKNIDEINSSLENIKFYNEIIFKAEYKLKSINNNSKNNKETDLDNNKIKEENQKKEEERKKQEAEKQKQKEDREKKKAERIQRKQEKKEILAQKKQEKLKEQEELKKQREEEREKQREEARIEEELLGDNLYPKTKNNRNI